MFYPLNGKFVLFSRYQGSFYVATCDSENVVTDKWDFLIKRIVEMTGCDPIDANKAASDFFGSPKIEPIN